MANSLINISVIVPTLNEEANIQNLVKRIDKALTSNHINYEVIFIDDHSTDRTITEIEKIKSEYPIQVYSKIGNKGKAQSLMEGFSKAKYELIGMIDADLQYPPEALPSMANKINDTIGVVVARRVTSSNRWIRKLSSQIFSFVFGNLLHGMCYDVQSGLKVFRKEILEKIELNPSQWSFDLEFLVKASKVGYKIDEVDIEFIKRQAGESKISLLSSSWEMALSAIKLKFKN